MDTTRFSFEELSDELEPQYNKPKKRIVKESEFHFASFNEEDDSAEPEVKKSDAKVTLQKLLDEKDKHGNLRIESDTNTNIEDSFQDTMLDVFIGIPSDEQAFFFQTMRHNSTVTSFPIWQKTFVLNREVAAVGEVYKIYLAHEFAYGVIMIKQECRNSNLASQILDNMINVCKNEKIGKLRIEVPENNEYYKKILKGFTCINHTINCDVYERKIPMSDAIKENMDVFSFDR